MAVLHGGRVAVVSTLGQGSRFTIILPWAATLPAPERVSVIEPPAHMAVPESSQAAPATRILLAENEENNIYTLSTYLEAKGYQVVVARDGVEALACVHNVRPALILMDIQMPGMDGLEAIRRIRADATVAAIPIIALTALAMAGDRERCLAAGADDYIAKPVSLRGLVTTIEACLRPPTATVELPVEKQELIAS